MVESRHNGIIKVWSYSKVWQNWSLLLKSRSLALHQHLEEGIVRKVVVAAADADGTAVAVVGRLQEGENILRLFGQSQTYWWCKMWVFETKLKRDRNRSCVNALWYTYWTNTMPRPRIYRPSTPDFFALLFMIYSTAAYDSYKFEWEIQIQSNDLNSLAASIQEMLLGERFQRHIRSI